MDILLEEISHCVFLSCWILGKKKGSISVLYWCGLHYLFIYFLVKWVSLFRLQGNFFGQRTVRKFSSKNTFKRAKSFLQPYGVWLTHHAFETDLTFLQAFQTLKFTLGFLGLGPVMIEMEHFDQKTKPLEFTTQLHDKIWEMILYTYLFGMSFLLKTCISMRVNPIRVRNVHIMNHLNQPDNLFDMWCDS